MKESERKSCGGTPTERIEKSRYLYGNLLIFACAFLYASSMAAKGIFVAEQKYVADMWGLEYAETSMANTYYFVLYGLVQVVLFALMQRVQIVKYVLVTVPLAALTTALIGTANNIQTICLFFGLSGGLQAGIYCGCNYVLTEYLPVKLLTKANKFMNAAYAVGTVIAYMVCAFCITWDLWRVPYFTIGGVFFLSLVVFGVVVYRSKRFKGINKRLDKARETVTESGEKVLFSLDTRKSKTLFYVLVIVLGFFIASLYYSVMNYVTSLLVDVHKMSQNISIYISVIAPIAITFGPMFTINSCEKNKNFIAVGIRYLFMILPVPLLLVFVYDRTIVGALILSVLFIVVANGVKSIVLSVITFQMRKQINAGAYSAIANAVASVSGGITPTVIGRIIDVSGWAAAYFSIFALLGAILLSLLVINILLRRAQKKA